MHGVTTFPSGNHLGQFSTNSCTKPSVFSIITFGITITWAMFPWKLSCHLRTNGCVFASQTKYAKRLLEKSRKVDCKTTSTYMDIELKLSSTFDSKPTSGSVYRQSVWSLIYLLATNTNVTNLSFAVRDISRFMTAPNTDDWARLLDDWKSTTAYVLRLGTGANIRWAINM